jgi:O-antigen ligase
MTVTSHPDDTPAITIPLQHFRAKTVRQKIHRQELKLVWIVGAQLVFLPWAFGGMPMWSQLVSFGLSILAIAMAIQPRNYDETTAPGQAPFRLYTLPKLIRFHAFWLGLAFLGYVALQALNPAWIYATDGQSWWMQAKESVKWLPSGVDVPFDRGGPWRMLIIYTTVWLDVCAVWIGFTRRRSFQFLFTALVTNGFVLAGVGMLQRLKGNGKILGLFDSPASYFVATIIYKNHAAAYFNILLGLAAGMSYWYYTRSLRRLEKSSPAGIFAFFATGIAVIVLFSFSRAGTILLVLLTALILAILLIQQLRFPADQRRYLTSALFVIFLGSFAWLASYSLRLDSVTERMGLLFKGDREASIENREIAQLATWEMAHDNLAFGWGSGSFRFYFPVYQQHHLEIYRRPDGRRMYWEHAHNDYLEWLAEFGVIGFGMLVLGAASAGWLSIKLAAWENPLVLFGLLGLGTTLAHAWVDFPFQNPAILTTWCVLLPALGRWAELEELNTRC